VPSTRARTRSRPRASTPTAASATRCVRVNTRLDQIGQLGSQIVAAHINGNEAGDLEDKRDQLIREVGEQIPVQVIPDKTGAITLQLAGQRTLVGATRACITWWRCPDSTSGNLGHLAREPRARWKTSPA